MNKTKINYLQFKKEIENSGKTYFAWHDLKKSYYGPRESFKVLLSNWVKKRLIYHLGRGFYAFNLASVDYLRLANEFDRDSYISFEYALYYHNLINQVPSIVTSATKKRSRKITMSNWTFEYTHIKNGLFSGYELENKIYIATPEKALADLLYLISRGKRIFEFDTLEIRKLNSKKLWMILKKFPVYTQKLAKKLEL